MVLSTYEKQRILSYHQNGLLPSQILSALKVEGIYLLLDKLSLDL